METAKVRFIPDQTGGMTASAPIARNNPLYLMWHDLRVLCSLVGLVPKLYLPWSTTRKSDELYMKWPNAGNVLAIAGITLLGFLLVLAVNVTFLLAPGFISLPATIAALAWLKITCASLHGPTVVRSIPSSKNRGAVTLRPDEMWVFVNGVLSTYGFQRSCDRVARTFGRPITGIYNPTYGLIGDLLECIVQRSFSYNTLVTRVTYDYVKEFLIDPTVRKVVLIGHSQGCIIISMVLDMLYASLSSSDVEKLEIYTFGSAASHFNNPWRQTSSLAPCARVVKHIEHYVNEEDLVPRWSALYNARAHSRVQYAGNVFIRLGATGHLLNQHYLSEMFPPQWGRNDERVCFLDEVVDIDEDRSGDRGTLAQGQPSVWSGFPTGGRNTPLPNSEGHKRTVREVSRLWRYIGGKDADEDMKP